MIVFDKSKRREKRRSWWLRATGRSVACLYCPLAHWLVTHTHKKKRKRKIRFDMDCSWWTRIRILISVFLMSLMFAAVLMVFSIVTSRHTLDCTLKWLLTKQRTSLIKHSLYLILILIVVVFIKYVSFFSSILIILTPHGTVHTKQICR